MSVPELGQPGPVEEPAQDQHRLAVAAQRPPTAAGAAPGPLGGQQPRHEQHDLRPDGKHGGVADRSDLQDSGEQNGLWKDVFALPEPCVRPRHLAPIGVSRPRSALLGMAHSGRISRL